MPEESIKNTSFHPALIDYYPLLDAKFYGNCLINNNHIIYGFRNIINICISYNLDPW